MLLAPVLMQMEVEFDSMADWDGFLSKIPYQAHKAWTQRIASMVVDGSPVWQVRVLCVTACHKSQGSLSTVPLHGSTAVINHRCEAEVVMYHLLQVHRTIPLTVTTPEEAAASSRATQPSASSSSTRASSKELVLTDQVSTQGGGRGAWSPSQPVVIDGDCKILDSMKQHPSRYLH